MSISSVITLGYGHGVNFIPTLGYLSGEAPTPSPEPEPSGGGGYTYITPYQRLQSEEYQREKIKKAKTDLDRLENVLRETERQKALAAESANLARQKQALNRALQLEAKEREYLDEINRLLMVRGELMRRIRSDEEFLVIIIMARKRLRGVVNLASINRLH